MKKKAAMAFAIGIAVISTAIIIGYSIRFSYQKPQTVPQDLLSRAGYGRPDANASSKTVFLGDSITFLEDWNVLFGVSDIANAGISGNTTDDVLARLDSAISARPQKLFLMIGINDLLRGRDVPYVFANYEKIISEIRSKSPDTKIYMQSVLPVDNDISKSRYGTVDAQKILELNDKIKTLADDNKLFFLDLYPSFCGADNKLYPQYSADGLHPNAYGYAAWENLIVAQIK